MAEDLPSYTAYANALRAEEYNRLSSAIFEALKSAAEITDNRALYY